MSERTGPNATSGPAEHLVIAYGFAPFADPSAIAATKTVVARGERVDVVQQDLGDLRESDPTLAEIADPLVGNRVVCTGRSRFAGWHSITAFCEQGEAAVTSWLAERDGRPYASVYSRAHFVASHVLAALTRDQGWAGHWIAEFSDVLTRTATGEPRSNPVLPGPLTDRLAEMLQRHGVAPPGADSSFLWAQTLALTLADELVFTNAAQRDAVLDSASPELADRARERSTIRPHATLPPEYYDRRRVGTGGGGAPGRGVDAATAGAGDVDPPARTGESGAPGHQDREVVRIGYFGNLYAAQSADSLLLALGAVPAALRRRLRLTVHTGSSGTPRAQLQTQVAAHGLTDVVDVRPPLPFLDFLAIAADQDVLLALDAETPAGSSRNPVLLSKLSDYLGAGVPIWAVVDPGSPLDRSTDPAIRHRSRLGDAVGAAQVLTTLALTHRGGAQPRDGTRSPGAATDSEAASGEDAEALAVCFAFPPDRPTSGLNAAKRVRERGEPVDVVQNDLGRRLGTDETLDLIAGPLIRRRAVLRGPHWFGGWSAVEPFVTKGLAQVETWVAERGRPYRSLYSRSHYAASAFLAARVKQAWPSTRWTAEFSDPLSRDITGGVRRASEIRQGPVRDAVVSQLADAGWDLTPAEAPEALFAWAEQLCYAFADEIVFTNEAQRELMLGVCHDARLAARARGVSTIRPHPTPDPGLYHLAVDEAAALELEPGLVHVAYFGAFYKRRPASVLLRAVEALPPSDRERLRLHVFTKTHEDVAQEARALGVDDVVRVRPPVPYLQMLALSRRMSVLLVIDANRLPGGRPNPFLPSKWSEYRGAGVPVWGMVDEDSPLSRLPLDLRSPAGHITGAMQVLALLARTPSARASR